MWYGFFSSMEQEEFTTTIHSYIENEKNMANGSGVNGTQATRRRAEAQMKPEQFASKHFPNFKRHGAEILPVYVPIATAARAAINTPLL